MTDNVDKPKLPLSAGPTVLTGRIQTSVLVTKKRNFSLDRDHPNRTTLSVPVPPHTPARINDDAEASITTTTTTEPSTKMLSPEWIQWVMARQEALSDANLASRPDLKQLKKEARTSGKCQATTHKPPARQSNDDGTEPPQRLRGNSHGEERMCGRDVLTIGKVKKKVTRYCREHYLSEVLRVSPTQTGKGVQYRPLSDIQNLML